MLNFGSIENEGGILELFVFGNSQKTRKELMMLYISAFLQGERVMPHK